MGKLVSELGVLTCVRADGCAGQVAPNSRIESGAAAAQLGRWGAYADRKRVDSWLLHA